MKATVFFFLIVCGQNRVAATASRIILREHLRSRPPVTNIFTPSHKHMGLTHLDYGDNHPFRRHLQSQQQDVIDYGINQTYTETRNNYETIRFRFVLEPILSEMGTGLDDKIESIINEILPAVETMWSQHLAVFPVQGNIPVYHNACFGVFQGIIPDSGLNNVTDADLVVLVHGKDILTFPTGETINLCKGTAALAVAAVCSLDQYDRPVVAFINFCLNNLSTLSKRRHLETDFNIESLWSKQVGAASDSGSDSGTFLVATHEIGHALGMSSDLIKYFRKPDGTPRTARPFQSRSGICLNGTTVIMEFPDESYFEPGLSIRYQWHYSLSSPRSQQAARNQFNCPSLKGTQMENQPTEAGGDVCIGTHLDERLFFSELMSPIFSGYSSILSPVTLAWLDDSGWYDVSYEGAKNSPFGLGAGCAFVEQDCIQNNQIPDFGLGDFCDSPIPLNASGAFDSAKAQLFCDPGHSLWSYCDLLDLENVPQNISDLIPKDSIRYFSDHPSWSASSAQADWCPIPNIYAGIDCTDDSTSLEAVYHGERYGSGSRCINADFVRNAASSNRLRWPACLPVQCNENTTTVTVGGQECEYDGQQHSIGLINSFSSSGIFICPKLTTLCPHFFCEGGCSAKGVCNYDLQPPRCECLNASDTSENCSGAYGTRPPSTLAFTPAFPSFKPETNQVLSTNPPRFSPNSGTIRTSGFVCALVFTFVALVSWFVS